MAQALKTGDITSEHFLPQLEALTKAHPPPAMLVTHSRSHTSTRGDPPPCSRDGHLASREGLQCGASSKIQRPLETHSCCYLTQRLNSWGLPNPESTQSCWESKRRRPIPGGGLWDYAITLTTGSRWNMKPSNFPKSPVELYVPTSVFMLKPYL